MATPSSPPPPLRIGGLHARHQPAAGPDRRVLRPGVPPDRPQLRRRRPGLHRPALPQGRAPREPPEHDPGHDGPGRLARCACSCTGPTSTCCARPPGGPRTAGPTWSTSTWAARSTRSPSGTAAVQAAVRPRPHRPHGRAGRRRAPPHAADVQAAAGVGRHVHRRPAAGPAAGERRRAADHDPRPHDRDAVRRRGPPGRHRRRRRRRRPHPGRRQRRREDAAGRGPHDRRHRLRRRHDRPRGAVHAVDLPRHLELSHHRRRAPSSPRSSSGAS